MISLHGPARALLRWRAGAASDTSLVTDRADRTAVIDGELATLERTGDMGPHLAAAAELSRTLYRAALEHRRALLAKARTDPQAAQAARSLLVDTLATLEFRLDSARRAPLPNTTLRALQAERDEALAQLQRLPADVEPTS